MGLPLSLRSWWIRIHFCTIVIKRNLPKTKCKEVQSLVKLLAFFYLKIYCSISCSLFSKVGSVWNRFRSLWSLCAVLLDHEIWQIWFPTRLESKTWFFILFNVYVSWIERVKILISHLSPQKFKYLTDQNVLKRWPHEK